MLCLAIGHRLACGEAGRKELRTCTSQKSVPIHPPVPHHGSLGRGSPRRGHLKGLSVKHLHLAVLQPILYWGHGARSSNNLTAHRNSFQFAQAQEKLSSVSKFRQKLPASIVTLSPIGQIPRGYVFMRCLPDTEKWRELAQPLAQSLAQPDTSGNHS